MVRLTADAYPEKGWMSTYLGVVEAGVHNQSEQGMFQRIAAPYALMCAAIDNFINAEYAEEVLRGIAEIEIGNKETCEEGTEAYMFWMSRDGVTFEFQYGENGPEKGGEVTLAQFKIAVRTYLQFLRDPERKPIEVPFPQS